MACNHRSGWLGQRYVTNPIQRLWPAGSPAFAFLSTWAAAGAPYRTPLNVFSADVDGRAGRGDFAYLRPEPRLAEEHYRGRNGGRMRRYGKPLVSPTRAAAHQGREAAPYVSSRWRPVFARLPFDEAVPLTGPIKGRRTTVVTSNNTQRPLPRQQAEPELGCARRGRTPSAPQHGVTPVTVTRQPGKAISRPQIFGQISLATQ